MQQAVDYDTQLSRVHALLTEWGKCQRREPSPMVQGYPRASVEGRMMDQWGERNDGSVPMRAKSGGPRQTLARVAKTGGEWPEHVLRVDRVLARLDSRPLAAIKRTYIHGCTLREVAFWMGVNKTAAAQCVDRARWFLLGALAEVDA